MPPESSPLSQEPAEKSKPWCLQTRGPGCPGRGSPFSPPRITRETWTQSCRARGLQPQGSGWGGSPWHGAGPVVPALADGSAWWHTRITCSAFPQGSRLGQAGEVERRAELGLGLPMPKMAQAHCSLEATSAPRSDRGFYLGRLCRNVFGMPSQGCVQDARAGMSLGCLRRDVFGMTLWSQALLQQPCAATPRTLARGRRRRAVAVGVCPLCPSAWWDRAAATRAGRKGVLCTPSPPHSLLNSCGLWKAPGHSASSGVTLRTGQDHRNLPFAAGG